MAMAIPTMILSRILLFLTLCSLHVYASEYHASKFMKRDLPTRHQPLFNPADHYYNTTGSRHLLSAEFNSTFGNGVSKRSNLMEKRHHFTKRHFLGSVHQEILTQPHFPKTFEGRFKDIFQHILIPVAMTDDTPGLSGNQELDPGCRPIWYGCLDPPEVPAGRKNGEYIEICNFSGDKRIVGRREMWDLALKLMSAQLWPLLAHERYAIARDNFKVDDTKISPMDNRATNYPGMYSISPYMVGYSWVSNDPKLGAALYYRPPILKDQGAIEKVWGLKCETRVGAS